MHTLATVQKATNSVLLQRKCACGGECDRCKKESELRRTAAAAEAPAIAPPIVHDVLHRQGQPLDRETQEYFESKFRFDFRRVRIHNDGHAGQSARAVNAKAYTVGSNVVFGPGNFSPNSATGRELLAHELAHVIQQSGKESSNVVAGELPIATSVDSAEREALQAENLTGTPHRGSRMSLQRKPEDAARQCGGTWTCAASPCKRPDPGREGTGGAASDQTLKVMIDAEAPSAEDVQVSTIGHTYVEFSDSRGAAYTYGFYPDKSAGTPDPLFRPVVAGCVVHPDTNHAACVDYTESFKLSRAEYQKALGLAQLLCAAPPRYNIQTNNCTTFAKDIVAEAGKSLPPIRGNLGRGSIVIPADNPYTLIEGLRRRDIGPTYNLTSDSELRAAISAAKPGELTAAPVAEKIRVINRLLDGWVSDDDIHAIETLCASIATSAEMSSVKKAVQAREEDLSNSDQKRKFHSAINRTP